LCVGDSLERGCVDVKVGGDWRDYRVLVSMVVSGVEARHDKQSPKPNLPRVFGGDDANRVGKGILDVVFAESFSGKVIPQVLCKLPRVLL
jgi:hypothetical protein